MKKYEKPTIEIIELRINERIASNGVSDPNANGVIHGNAPSNPNCS